MENVDSRFYQNREDGVLYAVDVYQTPSEKIEVACAYKSGFLIDYAVKEN